jgi:hypothetical protein
MARRRRTSAEALPDPCGRQAGRLPEQWGEISPAELQRRHQQAASLVAGRLPLDYLEGSSSHGELFDQGLFWGTDPGL